MSALKLMAMYDAVPVKISRTISLGRLFYVAGETIQLHTGRDGNSRYVSGGTLITPDKHKALVSAGRMFIMGGTIATTINAYGDLVTLSRTKVLHRKV
jgi:hypothetical protein